MAYRFANQSEVKELTACCMKILYAVQDEVSDYFTFDIRLIGSGDKRLVRKTAMNHLIWITILFCKKTRKVY